ncbi:periplasmic component of the Tol biopolymer transport system [Rubidibacter lacunae KORDI 51-2]|uniref:Periplasmic component of the Tol biopolymer transport system n=1 Tax=Rubidibacter lacunae KORDI 51-2 TaxID=582515 RepID=U5DHX0_9CHRO|nr:PD40 domain-containing protein [Rubidibacter lacunae]ERN41256.1 periplasmic component of the Tol biopolymer transport system [Rubidibacter lacunae KORDI 51-2]
MKASPKQQRHDCVRRWLYWCAGLCSIVAISACGGPRLPEGPQAANSPFNDEHPALSGNGRYLAWVSDRDGRRQILMYDLERQRYVMLPGLDRQLALVESPSLSRTGRYLTYLVDDRGRPAVALYDRAVQTPVIIALPSRSWIRNPSISPNGRFVVYERARQGQWDIEVLDRGPDVEPDIADGTPVQVP